MSNKYLYISFRFIICMLLFMSSDALNAQVTNNIFEITEEKLWSGTVFEQDVGNQEYIPGIGLAMTSYIQFENQDFKSDGFYKNMRISDIEARAYLNDGWMPEKPILSTQRNALIIQLLSIVSWHQQIFPIMYRFNIYDKAWLAGKFKNTILFSKSGLGWFGIFPQSYDLVINIPPIVSIYPVFTDFDLEINSLDYFRNGYTYQAENRKLLHTIPYTLKLNVDKSIFEFTGGAPNVPSFKSNTSSVRYQMSDGPGIRLGNSKSLIYTVESVPVGNKTNIDQKISISANSLKNNFLNRGFYTTNLTYSGSSNSSFILKGLSLTRALKIEVADMSELRVNNRQVSLSFKNISDYKNGTSVDIKDHLVVSRTIPYSVSVRASMPTFSNNSGNATIPLSVLKIGPADGQEGMKTITLSTINQRLLISNTAKIDEKYSVRYAIPAEEAAKLIGKPKGRYTTEIRYTISEL